MNAIFNACIRTKSGGSDDDLGPVVLCNALLGYKITLGASIITDTILGFLIVTIVYYTPKPFSNY